MTHSPALQKVPPTVVSLADHEQHARQQLDDNAWAYFSGGAADEITLRANRSAWDALPLWPRVLFVVGQAHHGGGHLLQGGGMGHCNEKSTWRLSSKRKVLSKRECFGSKPWGRWCHGTQNLFKVFLGDRIGVQSG